jgi:flagellar basal-body rod modification protein FlgD
MEMIPGVFSIDNSKTVTKMADDDGALGKDDFLKLLIAQLSAQDPLDPMGAQDFSAQLAQFSGLEQMTNVNTNLEILQKLQTASQNTSSLNLIGKTVESYGNAFNHSANSSETLSYSLASDAVSVRIDMFDSTGSQVDMIRLDNQGQGKNTASWDGFDKHGNPLPAGTYSYTVKADNQAGVPIAVDTFSSGLVSDVVFGKDETYAIVNGKELPISAIKRVSINQ